MSTECMEKANRYFLQRTKKVYIERCTKIESFEEYLSHRYRDNCYYYSAYALMGLKPDDFLVRGYIDLDDWKDYHHGWVEFKFEEEEYVFDSRLKEVVLKQEYYEYFNPRIEYKKTQKEILAEYLNERCASKIQDGFWQFKYIVMNTDKDDIPYREIIANDKNNGHVPSALMLARVVISKYSSEITRFIAYSEPSG